MDAKKVAQAFPDHKGPWHLYRSIYKYTACGPWMVVEMNGQTYSCDDIPMKWEGNMVAIKVGSIVEGVEDCTESYSIHLDKVKGEGKVVSDYIKKTFFDLVEQVDKEAGSIWDRTHGCEGCAEHFGIDWECGDCPVYEDCRQCGGEGVII